MRGRKKEPEGKRVTICAKVSEQTADAIDAARGGTSRSAWVQEAITAKLAGVPGVPAPSKSDRLPAAPSVPRRPAHSPNCKCGICKTATARSGRTG